MVNQQSRSWKNRNCHLCEVWASQNIGIVLQFIGEIEACCKEVMFCSLCEDCETCVDNSLRNISRHMGQSNNSRLLVHWTIRNNSPLEWS